MYPRYMVAIWLDYFVMQQCLCTNIHLQNAFPLKFYMKYIHEIYRVSDVRVYIEKICQIILPPIYRMIKSCMVHRWKKKKALH